MTTEPEAEGIRLSQDPAADALLARSPFALLVGTLLEQHQSVETAFRLPYMISERLGADLTASAIAALDDDQFVAVLSEPTPIHSHVARIGQRVHLLAAYVSEQYGGDPTRLWTEISTGEQLLARIRAMPGFGNTRARILLALLGKQFGITPEGWREASEPYGEEGSRLSVADVTGQESLIEVRASRKDSRKEQKAAAKANRSNKQRGGRSPSAAASTPAAPTPGEESPATPTLGEETPEETDGQRKTRAQARVADGTAI